MCVFSVVVLGVYSPEQTVVTHIRVIQTPCGAEMKRAARFPSSSCLFILGEIIFSGKLAQTFRLPPAFSSGSAFSIKSVFLSE